MASASGKDDGAGEGGGVEGDSVSDMKKCVLVNGPSSGVNYGLPRHNKTNVRQFAVILAQ